MPDFAARMLSWYDHNARRLPWRARDGAQSDPYRVWLSEIMLQQTTIAAATPYFQRFVERWPTVRDLAASHLDDVLAAWAGLGYYSRARNLHACARMVAHERNGRFPQTAAELRRLPGIGDYTAAAIASICFGEAVAVVDGNVERVVCRHDALTDPPARIKADIRARTQARTPDDRPGDFAQAMMDLGATLCVPRDPKCILCPVSSDCAGRIQGIARDLPAKAPKKPKPTRRGLIFWASDDRGQVLLRRRPETGVLAGMLEVPGTPWIEQAAAPVLRDVLDQAPIELYWRALPGLVAHTFTHFHLELAVVMGRTPHLEAPEGCLLAPIDTLDQKAMPSVMMKIVRHVAAHGRRGPEARTQARGS